MLFVSLALLLISFTSSASSQTLPCRDVVDAKLCEKIGQMVIVGFGGFNQDVNGKVVWNDKDRLKFNKHSIIARHIRDNHIGGVILFKETVNEPSAKVHFMHERNIENPQQVTALNQGLQNYNRQIRKSQGLAEIPLFISVDQEGGTVCRLDPLQGFVMPNLATRTFGIRIERAVNKTLMLRKTFNYASEVAHQMHKLNFNLNFAPVVDVNVNPQNPIIARRGRSFSKDPYIVSELARQFVKALNKHNIAPSLKHFPGHGSSTADSHKGLVDVTDTYKLDIELQPYRDLIGEGYDGMIMTTHVINGQLDKTQCKVGKQSDHNTWCPGTMSKKTLTDLLRKQLGFKGIIVSDDMTMGAITHEYPLRDALKYALNAGVNIFIVANNHLDHTDEVISIIAQLVKNGDVPQRVIEGSYKKIVSYKRKQQGAKI